MKSDFFTEFLHNVAAALIPTLSSGFCLSGGTSSILLVAKVTMSCFGVFSPPPRFSHVNHDEKAPNKCVRTDTPVSHKHSVGLKMDFTLRAANVEDCKDLARMMMVRTRASRCTDGRTCLMFPCSGHAGSHCRELSGGRSVCVFLISHPLLLHHIIVFYFFGYGVITLLNSQYQLSCAEMTFLGCFFNSISLALSWSYQDIFRVNTNIYIYIDDYWCQHHVFFVLLCRNYQNMRS